MGLITFVMEILTQGSTDMVNHVVLENIYGIQVQFMRDSLIMGKNVVKVNGKRSKRISKVKYRRHII